MKKILVALVVVGFVFSLAVVSSLAEKIQFKTYIVKAGDTLGEIAYALKVEQRQLLEWNQGLGTALQIGQEIKYLTPKDVSQATAQKLGEMSQVIRSLEKETAESRNEVVKKIQQEMNKDRESRQTFFQSLQAQAKREGKRFYLLLLACGLAIATVACFLVFTPQILKTIRGQSHRSAIKRVRFKVNGQHFTFDAPVENGRLGSLNVTKKGERRWYLGTRDLSNSLKRTVKDYLTKKRGNYTLLESALADGTLNDLDGTFKNDERWATTI